MFPAFLNLRSRRAVVVGGGPVAASKLEALLAAGADVTVVAPEVVPEIDRPGVTVVRRPFEDADLDGAWWVVAAAPAHVNKRVRAAADARRIFVNAVDDPLHATAYLGGVVKRDGVTIAISTDGRAPALSGLLREGIDAVLPPDLGTWLSAADAIRREWKEQNVPMERRRPQLLDTLNKLYDGRTKGEREGDADSCHSSARVPVIRGSGLFAQCDDSRRPTWCCTTRSSMPTRFAGRPGPSAFVRVSVRAGTACRRRRFIG
jgi:siroheme synthase-like protein